MEDEKVPTPTKDETPTKGRSKGKDKDKDADKKGRKTSARGQRDRGRRVSSVVPSPPPGAQTPISEADGRCVTSFGVMYPYSSSSFLNFMWGRCFVRGASI